MFYPLCPDQAQETDSVATANYLRPRVVQHHTQWHSTENIMWHILSYGSWDGNHSRHRNPKYGRAGLWHEMLCSQSQTCFHLPLVNRLLLHPPTVVIQYMGILLLWLDPHSVPMQESLAAICANGSFLRDLWCADTGQLEKGKHKDFPEKDLRYTEVLFLKLRVWLENADGLISQRTHTMSGSLWCRLTWRRLFVPSRQQVLSSQRCLPAVFFLLSVSLA